MVILSAVIGFGVPYFINKMIRSDVAKDVEKYKPSPSLPLPSEHKLVMTKNPVFKDFMME